MKPHGQANSRASSNGQSRLVLTGHVAVRNQQQQSELYLPQNYGACLGKNDAMLYFTFTKVSESKRDGDVLKAKLINA